MADLISLSGLPRRRTVGGLLHLAGSWFRACVGSIKQCLLLAVAILLLWVSGAAQATTVSGSPISCNNMTGVGTVAWGTANNATTSDNSYATASVDGTTTNYLACTGYGFAIPANAIINGVTVNVERKSSSTANGGSKDAAVLLLKSGAIAGTDGSTSTIYTTSDVLEAHGGSTVLWGTTWTPANINANDFGVVFAATKASSNGVAHKISVDYIQIVVDYSISLSCAPPSNTPSGLSLTCQCDDFSRANLNPSPIFGSNWITSSSDSTGIVPSIVNGYLRLTDNSGNNAKAATVPGIFPAAGNYISVEFRQYSYNGSGADGIAVTLSDYAVPPVPGAFGGSLGYAQKDAVSCGQAGGCPGFAGGWLGVALDEYGNYSNPTEGRIGGPGAKAQTVGARGSGSGTAGYNWVGGTAGTLSPGVDNQSSLTWAPGYLYQVIVDARNASTGTTGIVVNRDTGSGYNQLFSIPNVYATNPSQAPVPANWQISFTGSTGGSANIHELGSVRICAQTVYPPGGGTASGFSAIDEAYGNPSTSPVPVQNYQLGHIYTKLMGVPFKLDVAALDKNNQIQTTYASSGTKAVTVKLVDNSDGACVLDNTKSNYCTSACQGKPAVATQTLNFVKGDNGQKQSTDFTINSAYSNLAAIISDTTPVTACATDGFSVRPTGLNVTATTATGTGIGGTPIFKAGSDQFRLTATVSGVNGSANGYTGVLKVNSNAIQAVSPATKPGALAGTFPAAVSSTPNAVATGTAFTYGEVGVAQLNGYTPALGDTQLRAVYDGVASSSECTPSNPAGCDILRAQSWTGVDSISAKNDCILDSYSNTRVPAGQADAGKYGCNFGMLSPVTIGRFVPDHFDVSATGLQNRNDPLSCSPVSIFTYMNEPMLATFTLTARNAENGATENYEDNPSSGSGLAKLNLGVPTNFNLGALDGTSLTSRLAGLSSSGIGGGWVKGVANVQLGFMLARAAAPDGPFAPKFGIAPKDGDGIAMRVSDFNLDTNTPATANNHFNIGSTLVRFGRLKLANAFGSEKLNLPIPVEAQYWNGVAFITNVDDSCSPLTNANAVLGSYNGGVSASNLGSSHISGLGTLLNGKTTLTLIKPDLAAVGGVDLAIKLGNGTSADQSCPLTLVPSNAGIAGANLTYLQSQWCGTDFTRDPRARVRFGVYKNANQMIYLREMY